MPGWIVYCPKCSFEILHSEISKDERVDPWLSTAPKPEFPNGGQNLECPTCKIQTVFQRHQLIYRR